MKQVKMLRCIPSSCSGSSPWCKSRHVQLLGLLSFKNVFDRRLTQTVLGSPVLESKYSTNSDESDNELDLEAIRNVSQLTPNQYRKYHGVPPDAPFKDLIFKKERYAQYGAASGEDPRIMWPTRSSLLALEEEEKEDNPVSLTERLAQLQAEKKAAEEDKIARRKHIEQNMQQMPKLIKEYRQKELQAQKERQDRAAKQKVLLEEAREHFGYKVQANDPKFKQMLEEKEEKEKAEVKKRKKEEKLKKVAARLAHEAAQSSKSQSTVS